MSISEEKLMILKMLEEGKITSEEAAKLIEALDGSLKQTNGETARQQKGQPNFNDEIDKLRSRLNEWKNDFKKNYNQKDFERIVDEFSTKAEKLGKNVANATYGVVDKVIDFVGSFIDTNAFNIFGSFNVVEKFYEADLTEGDNLDIEAVNGHIILKKHLGDKLVIRSKVRSANNTDEILLFNKEGNNISARINNKFGNLSITHEVMVPALKLGKVSLVTTNGKISAEDTAATLFESRTKNGPVDLTGIGADKVTVETKNARILLSYVIGKEVEINTTNSLIDIKNIKSETIKAVTTNGRILLENAQIFEGSGKTVMLLKTTNGGIKINMNDLDNKGYKVKAQTTNGGVNLLIPEMVYHNMNRRGLGSNMVEAESSDYEGYQQKVDITAETINGYVEIVK